MKFSYNKLWKLLIDKKISKQTLRISTGISSATMAKLNRGESVTTEILLRICKVLDCEINEIMEIER